MTSILTRPSKPWQRLRWGLGGDAGLSALYDPLAINAPTFASGNISALADARGASGFGPSFTNLSGTVAFNLLTGGMTFTGSNALWTAASAKFVLNTATSLFAVMSSSSGGTFFHGISSDGSATRALVIGGGGSHYIPNVDASNGTASTVAPDATIRLVIVSLDNASHMNIDVPNTTRVTSASGNPAAGNNVLTAGGYFQGANSASVLYAIGVIPRVVTVADIAALKAYALAKGATLA